MPRPTQLCLVVFVLTPPLAHAQLTFTEVTQQAGLIARYEVTPLPSNEISYMMAGGAIADFNNDGWDDIFVLAGDINRDGLFINNQDGTFTEQAGAWGIDEKHVGGGAVAGDYNDDGHVDLFVTSLGSRNNAMELGKHRLYRNNGDGTFTDVAQQAGVASLGVAFPDGFSPAFGDPDLDGDLDLVVAVWRNTNHGLTFFRNNGDGTFQRETDCLIGGTQGVRGFTPAFADMDGDRYPELLVASDFGTSAYYRNNADGSFTRLDRDDVGLVDTNGMGAVIADINQDGALDWFVSNICCVGEPSEWEGQNLFLNKGNHSFVDVAHESGVVDAVWGWGAEACDLDNDTDLDLVAVNGWGSSPMHNRVFEQTDNTLFEDVSLLAGFDSTELSRGVASLDYDNDGDIDLVVFNHEGPVQLYRNDTPNVGGAITIDLDTTHRPDLAPGGFGTWIEVTAGGITQRRYVDGASNFLANSTLTEHVGVGDARVVDEIRVLWQDGRETVLSRLAPDQGIVVTPPPTCSFPDTTGDGLPDFGDFDPTGDGATDIEDLYRAATADINSDAMINDEDARCMTAYLRVNELDPR